MGFCKCSIDHQYEQCQLNFVLGFTNHVSKNIGLKLLDFGIDGNQFVLIEGHPALLAQLGHKFVKCLRKELESTLVNSMDLIL